MGELLPFFSIRQSIHIFGSYIVRIIPGLFYLALEAEMVFPTFPVKTWRIFVLFRSKVQKIRRTVLQQTHITENMKI